MEKYEMVAVHASISGMKEDPYNHTTIEGASGINCTIRGPVRKIE